MGLMTRTTAGHQVHIYRNVAGQYTSLAMQSLQGFSGVGALRFEVVGASLKLFVNNILRAVAHDSRITAAGLAGMRSRAGASLDNVNVAGILVENASPPFTDEFAKPNDSSLNRVWTERLGAFTIQNEAAVATNLVANNLATLNTAALANAIVQADITLATNGASAGLVARYSGPGEANFYLGTVTRTASGFEAHLYRNLAGQYALLATKKLIGFSGTGELRFEVVGTSLKLFVDNHLQVEASDSMITAAGLVGMRGRTGAAFDNFHV
jgi:hypothetical protein